MRIKHRFIINNSDNGFDIIGLLCQQGIKPDKSNIYTVFELFEDQDNFNNIIDSLLPYGFLRNPPVAVYTKGEIEAAQWLTIRSTWRSLYPQPEENMGYKSSTYDSTNYCEKCKCGLIQKENFMLKKELNWGPRNFSMINWVQDELFISKKADVFLRTSNLTGFNIYDVSTISNRILQDVKQIFVKNYLDYGLMHESLNKELHCTKCNNTIFMAKPVICYDSKVFKNVNCDIVKTKEKYGELTRSSLIFITHKFYEAITTANLDRGLVFEPIKLV